MKPPVERDTPERSDDDALLARLGEVARDEDAALDPRLDALLDGTISPADRAALEADATEDPELARALAAFRPLDDAAVARIGGAIAAARASSSASPARPAPEVVPIARARRGVAARAVPIVGALAVAAAAVLYLARSSGPPLPPYELVVGGGDKAVRGGDAAPVEVPSLSPASRFELVMRPASATHEAIEARAFLVRDGVARAWSVTPEISDEGAVRVAGRADALFPAGAGEWGVLLVIGRRGRVEVDVARAARLFAGAESAAELQLARARVRLGP